MGTGTLCTSKKASIHGHEDSLHWQKGPQSRAERQFALAKKGLHIWVWGHFALAKGLPYLGMGTLCTGKKAPIDGQWGHFHLAKSSQYMGDRTLCTGEKAAIHWALAKRPP